MLRCWQNAPEVGQFMDRLHTFFMPIILRSSVWGSSTETASTTRFAKNSLSLLTCRTMHCAEAAQQGSGDTRLCSNPAPGVT